MDPDAIAINSIKAKCRANGGGWMGFRLGDNDALLVRIRKTSPQRHYFLNVEEVMGIDKDYGTVRISDPTHHREHGIARRYNAQNFNPPE